MKELILYQLNRCGYKGNDRSFTEVVLVRMDIQFPENITASQPLAKLKMDIRGFVWI